MNLIQISGNERIKARIRRIDSSSRTNDEVKSNFTFDWGIEENEIYKLQTISDDQIIGLMSISNIFEEFRVHINLIESSIVNRGKEKKIKNIPHCLIAYACKQSFALGFNGFVSLYPKTELIFYYSKEYGFEQFGKLLAIYGNKSFNLIKEYLDEN